MKIIETNLKFKQMDTRKSTNRIILHHAAAINCSAEDIHRWHLNNGWSGAGYHFLVRKNGEIYRLRPEDKVGAHAYGSNYDSIGICFEGNYMDEGMPEIQKNVGKEIVAQLKNKYNISTVQGHRDVNATSCPGINFPFNEIANGKADEIIEKPAETNHSDKIATIQRTLNEMYGTNIDIDSIYGKETKKSIGKRITNRAK